MALIGVTRPMRLVPRRGAGALLTAGLVIGFVFHVFGDLVAAVELSGRVPAGLAPWLPAGVGGLLGMTTFPHVEDG